MFNGHICVSQKSYRTAQAKHPEKIDFLITPEQQNRRKAE